MDVDSNAETNGSIAQLPDNIKTPEDFAKVTIHSREDFAAVFDVEAIEEKHSFAADQVAYDLLVVKTIRMPRMRYSKHWRRNLHPRLIENIQIR